MRPTLLVVPLLLVAGVLAAPAANAANESVNIWLTTTNDSGGRNVTRGLQQQTPISFSAGTGTGQQTITVDENTRYQQFEGAGASFTDTAAYLMNSSGALSAATRNATMTKLFDPVNGIGLDFLRNPMGASDLARNSYTYDDGAADPNLNNFTLSHDMVDVIPLTKQAKQLNPQLKVMGSPWTAPPWMKDNNSYIQGWLQSQYYQAYANYFVKYIQGYAAQGIPVDYVSEQNEPTVGGNYPGMNWNGTGLAYFAKTNLLPALHNAGLSTKVLALDWNWDSYDSFGAPTVTDSSIRNDPNFGGVAWHGYEGDVSEQTTVHNQYPSMNMYETEHSGGNWIGNQQNEDMNNIIDYTRNWDRSVVKWSLAVNESQGPNNGGCNTCTGLITVHQNDSQRGQVDYNIEYYDMGQLTKFVKPGATRIASNDGAVRNVAWINPDGSKALVAYNPSGSAQSVRVNWGNESFTYSVPAATSATFTWSGTQGGTTTPPPGGGTITGIGGKCVDVAGANSANGTQVQLYTCNGSTAQTWTQSGSALQALGKCLDVASAGTANGTKVQLYDCNGTAAQQWTLNSQRELVNTGSGKCLDATNQSSADGTPLQIWSCTGTANQQWTLN
ncbi:ricin-type beta-trefoil lectin domain protein [Kutzneria sp. CA-103260]|uniref:ricin-type beta-trefoil lectin domain protein n=1 Tax=Kutzneria sp. CA-103260 TaxID=2802641 RepID=UPI001BED4223|nr:ricin-type beta-trefoil lectin domain protein [Kutzneria sp. CA-103260]QUQ67406.1 glucosylceramidase [Kutzneria sp. CA-103260]